MAGLSFGNFGSALPTGLDLSLGSSTLSPTYSGRGSYGMPTVAKSPTDFQYSKTTMPAVSTQVYPNLSYGSSMPKVSSGTFTPVPSLSYGKSGGSTLGNIIKSLPFSFGAPASQQPVYDDAIMRAARISGPSPIATVPQVDTVTIDGAVNAADAAKDLASQIFGDMLTPASFGGGQSSGSGGAGGFMDGLSTQDIVLIAAALGVAFLVLSGGSSGGRRRRR